MSYRTYVNDFQVFGNNDGYNKWIEFIENQGIKVDEEGKYDGYITDVMGAIEVLEKIVMDEEKKRQEMIAKYDFSEMNEDMIRKYAPRSIFDLTNIPYNINKYPDAYFLLDELIQVSENAYMFYPLIFIKACGDSIKRSHHIEGSNRFYCYEIKEGKKIHVCAR